MTTSPGSTRPATRRELRERAHAQAESAFRGPLPAFGDSLRAPGSDIIDDVPAPAEALDDRTWQVRPDTVRDDTVAPERRWITGFSDGYLDTGRVGATDAEPEPRFFRAPADGHPVAAEDTSIDTATDDDTDTASDADTDGDAELDALLEGDTPTREVTVVDTQTPTPTPTTEWADETRPPTALTWIDTTALTPESRPEPRTAPDLFAGAKLVPGWLRPRVLIPVGIVAALCGSYVATTLLWPLNAVAPVAEATKVEIAPAPVAAVTWPGTGSAAVTVEGIAPVASTTDRDEIASISKVASALMVLDELPLEPGEQGPSFDFDYGDTLDYWQYRRMDQSALDVPVGGSLTEYQMLQGVLLGSANNYIDRLSDELWGSDWAFAQASEKWLDDHGLDGMVLESPSGFDEDNIASPAAVLALGELAMKNPVFAEIVGTRSAEIPGAGTVTNTNGMLEDAGVVGIKTGTLSHWNLLTAKDVPAGDGTVRLYAAVLGQDDDEARLAVTRGLFAEVEAALAAQPIAVPKGTVVGRVTTEWGDRIDVVSDADAHVVLWNGAAATATTSLDLGDETAAGAQVGTLTAEGPLGTAETSVSLTAEITPPSIWWRLTHPLELLGID